MKEQSTAAAGAMEGARRATGMEPAAAPQGVEVKRWSAHRKREVVLRLLRGEPLDSVSRATGVELYRLEEWRATALAGIEEALRERSEGDPLVAALAQAKRCIGELTMENELLRERVKRGVLSR